MAYKETGPEKRTSTGLPYDLLAFPSVCSGRLAGVCVTHAGRSSDLKGRSLRRECQIR